MGVTEKFETDAHRAIQKLLQKGINEEFQASIKAKRYERNSKRAGFRKGTYSRYLTTTFGRSKLEIPRTRGELDVEFRMFNKYQRRQKKFDDMVIMSLVLGISTRKQKKFFRAFIGDAVSHATASRLILRFEEEVAEFRSRKLQDTYKYLLIDGRWVSVKEGADTRKRPIVFVVGITEDNTKEVLTFKLAKGETEEEITGILNDLYRRGLEGRNLKLIASDGAKGIRAAINMVYPYAKWQWCSTHKLRRIRSNIRHKAKNGATVMKEASEIYKAPSKREALTKFSKFCHKWKDEEPGAVRSLRRDFAETLAFYDYMDDKRFMSTTNHLERFLEEIRRRIKVQGYFKNPRSVDCWVYGIMQYVDSVGQPEGMPPSPMGEGNKELKTKSVHKS